MKTFQHSPRLGRRLLLTGACSLTLGGCFGSFGATRRLWSWNDDVGDKWVNWLVFLGLSIIPVYQLFVLADVLVLNSLEFWTGRNPVGRAGDGRTVTRVATADPKTIRLEVRRAGRLEYVAFCRSLGAGGLQILDASGQPLTSVCEQDDGSLELRAADQALLARLGRAASERVYALVEQGQPSHLVLERELGERTFGIARLNGEPAVVPQLL